MGTGPNPPETSECRSVYSVVTLVGKFPKVSPVEPFIIDPSKLIDIVRKKTTDLLKVPTRCCVVVQSATIPAPGVGPRSVANARAPSGTGRGSTSKTRPRAYNAASAPGAGGVEDLESRDEAWEGWECR